MRFIKLGVISILLLAIVVMAISFLLPSRILVQRAVQIDAPMDSVLKKVKDLNEWKAWLVNRDTLPINIDSNNGKQVLTMGNTKVYAVSSDSSLVSTKWQVNNGKLIPSYFSLSPDTNTPGTTVQWYFDQQLKWYPWEKFSSIVSDKVLSPFMEQSLENLKQVVEKAH